MQTPLRLQSTGGNPQRIRNLVGCLAKCLSNKQNFRRQTCLTIVFSGGHTSWAFSGSCSSGISKYPDHRIEDLLYSLRSYRFDCPPEAEIASSCSRVSAVQPENRSLMLPSASTSTEIGRDARRNESNRIRIDMVDTALIITFLDQHRRLRHPEPPGGRQQ